jgi:hypothetical protein
MTAPPVALLATQFAHGAEHAARARAHRQPHAGTAAALRVAGGGRSALLTRSRRAGSDAMLAVLGPDAKPIIESGDAVADRDDEERFVAGYDDAHALKHGTRAAPSS